MSGVRTSKQTTPPHMISSRRRVTSGGRQRREALPRCKRPQQTMLRFLQAALSSARLKPETAKQWLEPQIRLQQRCIQCLSTDQPDADQHIAWGLGWGLEPDAGTFFHWGDNDQFKAFVMGSRSDQSALVVFANGSNGMAIMPDVVQQLLPGDHPAFAWLNYSRNSAGRGVLDWLRSRWHR